LPRRNSPRQPVSTDLSANTEKPLTMGVTSGTESSQAKGG
jgi:hypothetical protein